MACLKCGAETAEGASFCANCMEDMEKYPVKPNTPVLLPPTRSHANQRKLYRWSPQPLKEKEQLARLYRWNQILILLLVLALLALAAVSTAYIRRVVNMPQRPTGQNYSTIATS